MPKSKNTVVKERFGPASSPSRPSGPSRPTRHTRPMRPMRPTTVIRHRRPSRPIVINRYYNTSYDSYGYGRGWYDYPVAYPIPVPVDV